MPGQMRIDDLKLLTDKEIQILLREIDQKDLVMALKEAPAAVRDKILGNMSERVRTFITEEIAYLEPSNSGEVLETQGRLIKQVLLLAEQGRIQWPKDGDAPAAAPKKPRISKKYQALKKGLKKKVGQRLEEMEHAQIDAMFADLAEIARREGILALEEFTRVMTDPYLKSAFQLAVDGTEPALIMDILTTWRESRVHEFIAKNNKVIEGIMAIQGGDNPRLVHHKTSLIY